MVTEFIVSDNRTSLHYVGTQEGLPLVGLKTLSTMGSQVITKIDFSNCNMGTVHSLFLVQLLEVQFSNLRALILDNCHLHDRVKLPRMPNVTILRYYLVRKIKALKQHHWQSNEFSKVMMSDYSMVYMQHFLLLSMNKNHLKSSTNLRHQISTQCPKLEALMVNCKPTRLFQ